MNLNQDWRPPAWAYWTPLIGSLAMTLFDIVSSAVNGELPDNSTASGDLLAILAFLVLGILGSQPQRK